MPTKHACGAVKSDGSQCQAAALPQSDFCFFHDPAKAAERREAHATGGRRNRVRTLDGSASDVRIDNSGDVMALLSQTIEQALERRSKYPELIAGRENVKHTQ